ncbi:MAG: MMPL family transporter, partial [Planctomycetaceae bacterium]|nr:MMPL family transporter [Planctomycetaceae bacterium]
MGVDETDIKMAGPVIDGLSVDEASQRSLANFAVPSSLIIFVVCWLSLRSVRAALIVFGCAVFCQGATLAVIFYTGETLSALLIILPPLIQVLAVAGGIHLTNYYFDAGPEQTGESAAWTAFRKGWLPCSLSAGTTAMGTASLMISELTPIRLFGIYATIGVLLTATIVLALIPSLLLLFVPPRSATSRFTTPPTPQEPAAAGQPTQVVVSDQRPDNWERLSGLLQRHNSAVLAVVCAGMFTAALGLPAITTSIRIETLFGRHSQILHDYQWLEDNVAPLVPIEIVVSFDHSCQLHDRQRMELLYNLNQAVREIDEFSSGDAGSGPGATSAMTFLPPIPPMNELPMIARAAALNLAVSRARPGFMSAGYLAVTDDAELWRITARTSALHPLDYGALLNQVSDRMQDQLQKDKQKYSGVTVSTSGIMPLVHQIQGRLLQDLFWSLMSALAVITITMTLVEAGLLNGLVAMISNVFPIVIVFGAMGWSAHPMDIGAVMTASVALGIAVDDTLHFLTFFRRATAAGRSAQQSVTWAYRHCGPAMIQTSVSCGLGLFIFSFSDFLPTARFAVMILGLLLL